MIIARELHKHYGQLHVLKGVNLNIKQGEIVSIVGASGAGKTTFVQGLAEELDVQGSVTSPTFVVSRVHKPKSSGYKLLRKSRQCVSCQLLTQRRRLNR